MALVLTKDTPTITAAEWQARVDLAAQSALFDRMLRLPVSFLKSYSIGDLADRVRERGVALAGRHPLVGRALDPVRLDLDAAA